MTKNSAFYYTKFALIYMSTSSCTLNCSTAVDDDDNIPSTFSSGFLKGGMNGLMFNRIRRNHCWLTWSNKSCLAAAAADMGKNVRIKLLTCAALLREVVHAVFSFRSPLSASVRKLAVDKMEVLEEGRCHVLFFPFLPSSFLRLLR